jgi:periplasmic protein CpxP/Spy
MKTLTLSMGFACLLAMPLAQAADEQDHEAHHPADAQVQDAPAPEGRGDGDREPPMRERMKKMQEQMREIHSTSDPEERKKLMQDHMQSMLEATRHMDSAGADGGKAREGKSMGDCKEGGEDAKEKDGMMKGGMMMKRHKKVEARLDMLQKMMEQMLEHERAEEEMESGH